MGLSAAERAKRYRAKRKEDKVRDEAYKNKEKLRNKKKKKVSDMTPREHRAMKKSWRKWDRNRRLREKALASVSSTPPPSPPSLPGGSSGNHRRGRRVILANSSKINRRNKKLEEEIQALKEKQIELRRQLARKTKKYRRLEQKLKENEIISPKTKAIELISTSISEEGEPLSTTKRINLRNSEVVKKLVFSESLVESLKEKKKENVKNKKMISQLVNSNILKKYKLRTWAMKKMGLKGRYRVLKERVLRERKNKFLVEAFFNSDDVSRATAGIKETLTRKKIKLQKPYLLSPMTKLFGKFKAAHPSIKISYVTFTRYRPFYVCLPTVEGRDTCICKTHSNINLLANKLNTLQLIGTKDVHLFIEEMVCNKQSFECMYNKCLKCKNKKLSVPLNDNDITKIVTWQQWGRSVETREKTVQGINKQYPIKVAKLIDIEGPLPQLIKAFEDKLPDFKTHIFNIRTQGAAYKNCKTRLEAHSALIHIDFSENYCGKYAKEVQEFHFGGSRNQVSIHTGIVYMKDKEPQPFASISPSLEHGPAAIWAHLHPLLTKISTETPNISIIHFFSDGPSSQYRQKKNFFLLTSRIFLYGFKGATWNFFEASHGKGAADGVGGALKRSANDAVAYGRDIPDALTFYNTLKERSTVELFFVTAAEVEKVRKSMPSDNSIIAIPNTRKIHQISCFTNKPMIRHRVVSCFCKKNNWFQQNLCDCYNWTLSNLLKLPQREVFKRSPISSELDSDEAFSTKDESDMDIDDLDENDPNLPILRSFDNKDQLMFGTYVLVEFMGGARGKNRYRYVGVCQGPVENDDVRVMFLKVAGENSSLFSMNEEDTSFVNTSQILGLLPAPNIKMKGISVYYKFPSSVDVREKV